MPLVQRVDGYAPIRDYGVIGDGRTCALVARDGAIDWLCLPNVDSPSTFARILDPERGGAFLLSPVEPFETEQSYVSGTNVLRTTFRTASGTARITDAMTLTDVAFISPLREVVRKVEALEGRVRFEWSVTPRFIYGRRDVNLSQRYGRPFFFAGKDGLAVSTWGAGETEFRDRAVGGEFELGPQETALFSLSAAFKEPVILPGRDDTERRLERAERFWAEWSGRVQHDGRWRDQVVRSALVLKLLVFAPSGAIVAAPTTSLPLLLGARRQLDARSPSSPWIPPGGDRVLLVDHARVANNAASLAGALPRGRCDERGGENAGRVFRLPSLEAGPRRQRRRPSDPARCVRLAARRRCSVRRCRLSP